MIFAQQRLPPRSAIAAGRRLTAEANLGLTLYAFLVVELWHEQVVERPRAAVGA